MKNSMGAQHSSLRCDRITMSVQNCFGLRHKTTNYETAVEKNNDDKEKDDHFTRTSTRSSKRISSCCTRSKTTDPDDFAYNLCSKDSTLLQADVNESTPSVINNSEINSGSCACLGDKTCQTVACKNKCNPENGVILNNGFIIVDSQPCSIPPRDMLVHTTDENIIKTVLQTSPEETISLNHTNHEKTSYLNNNSNCKHHNNAKSSTNDKECLDNTIKITTNTENTSQENDTMETDSNRSQNKEVIYFRNLIVLETNKLNSCIEEWSRVLKGDHLVVPCPSEVCDEIRTVIGQSHLVITERFTQFSSLVDRADGKTTAVDEKPVLISDLQGFWDMIYFQVEDVLKKFNSLNELKSNSWIVSPSVESKNNSEQKSKTTKKKTTQKKSPPKKGVNEEEKKRRSAARKRLMEARRAMNERKQQNNTSITTDNTEKVTDTETISFPSTSHETRTESINSSCSVSVVGLTSSSADSPLLSQIPSASELVH